MTAGSRALVLLACSVVAFTMALLGSSALGMGPDEPAHYVKAAATVRGDLVGERATSAEVRRHYPFARPRSNDTGERERARLVAESGTYNARFFALPDSLAFGDLFPCFAQARDVPASCGSVLDEPARDPGRVFSYVGTYPPVPYVTAGLGSLFPGDRSDRWYAARLIGAAVTLVLVACAAGLLLDGTTRVGWRVAGLAGAAIPTVLFTFAVVNASSWEIAGGLTVAAGVLRVSRPTPPTARTWALVTVGAVALATSRPTGPLWLVPFAIVLLVLLGRKEMVARFSGGRAPIVATVVVTVAAASTVLWVRFQGASIPILWDRVDDALRLAVSDLWLVVLQVPAIFGWNETPMAIPWYWSYGLGLVALSAVALVFAVPRERCALVVTIGLTLLAAIAIAAYPFEMYGQRYAMQARYVLPFAVLIPLLAGELLARGAERAPAVRAPGVPWYPTGGVLPAFVVGFMAVVNFAGWWTNSVRNARGFGGFAFWGDAGWVPPMGWVPWTVLAVVGLALGLSAAYVVWRSATDRAASPVR